MIAADGADFLIGDVVTFPAIANLLAKTNKGVTKLVHFLRRLLEHVQHEAQSSSAANAGQFGKFVYGIFKYSGVEIQSLLY